MPFDPSLATPKDRVRLKLGDINPVELFPDTTYEATLAYFDGNEIRVALELANALVVKYAQMATSVTLISGTQMTWRDRISAWQDLVMSLTNKNQVGSGSFAMLKPKRKSKLDGGAEKVRGIIGETWWTS